MAYEPRASGQIRRTRGRRCNGKHTTSTVVCSDTMPSPRSACTVDPSQDPARRPVRTAPGSMCVFMLFTCAHGTRPDHTRGGLAALMHCCRAGFDDRGRTASGGCGHCGIRVCLGSSLRSPSIWRAEESAGGAAPAPPSAETSRCRRSCRAAPWSA